MEFLKSPLSGFWFHIEGFCPPASFFAHLWGLVGSGWHASCVPYPAFMSQGLFTLVTSSCYLDVNCSLFDVNVKIQPDAQLVGVKKRSRPFFDVVKKVNAVINVKTASVEVESLRSLRNVHRLPRRRNA